MRQPFLFLAAAACISAHALTADEASAIAIGETDARIEALNKAVATADDRTVAFLQALGEDAVKVTAGRLVIVQDGKGVDPVSGQPAQVPDDAEDVVSNNRMRGEIDSALAALKLFSPDARLRREAVAALQKEPDESRLPMIEKAFAAERDAGIRDQLALVRAAALLGSGDKARRLAAAQLLAGSRNAATKTLLIERLAVETETDVKAALQASLREVESRLAWGEARDAVRDGWHHIERAMPGDFDRDGL